MTLQEFSAEFDILYNNIASNIAPGLTEYEKSVFLTQAQEQLVIEIYSGQYKGEPFESSEEVRAYLKGLIQTAQKTKIDEFTSELPDNYKHYKIELDARNFWFVIFESATLSGGGPCVDGKKVLVKPIAYDTYWSISRNPFKGPNNNRVLRINRSKNLIELISSQAIKEYILKYLSRPAPIILVPLEGGTSINGKTNDTPCELPTIIHRPILVRAVQLAKNVWGQTSEQE